MFTNRLAAVTCVLILLQSAAVSAAVDVAKKEAPKSDVAKTEPVKGDPGKKEATKNEVAKADAARKKPLQRCDQVSDKAEIECLQKARERVVEARRKREASGKSDDRYAGKEVPRDTSAKNPAKKAAPDK